jgi:hypothetical protein
MQSAYVVSYCNLWHVRLYIIFPHYLINGIIFVKKLLNTKCVLSLSKNFVWKIFHYKENWTRYDEKFILVFVYSIPYFYFTLIKFEYSQKIFKKSSHLTFHENTISGSRVPCVCGRTGGRTDKKGRRTHLTKLIVFFRNFANAPNYSKRLRAQSK